MNEEDLADTKEALEDIKVAAEYGQIELSYWEKTFLNDVYYSDSFTEKQAAKIREIWEKMS